VAEDVGSVYSEVRLKLDNLDHDILTASKKFDDLAKVLKDKVDKPNKEGIKSFGDLKSKILQMIPGLGAAVIAFQALSSAIRAGIQFAKDSVAAYQEQQIAIARIGAVLKSTGAEAWTTNDQLKNLADEQAARTGYAANDIQRMQAVLLGFTNVTGEQFTRSTEAIINMAAVMGGDLAGAANQFGKALENPAENLATLTRYGFKFSDEQKEMARTMQEAGDIAGAQNIVLQAMNTAFGNAADRVNEAVQSQSNYNNTMTRFKELSGQIVSTAFNPIRDAWTRIITKINEAIARHNIYVESMGKLSGEIPVPEGMAGQVALIDAEITKLTGDLGNYQGMITSLKQSPVFGPAAAAEIGAYEDLIQGVTQRISNLRSVRNAAAEELARQQTGAAAGARGEGGADTTSASNAKQDRLDAILKLQQEYNATVETALDMEHRGLIDSEERQNRILSARETEIGGLEALRVEYSRLGAAASAELDMVTSRLDLQAQKTIQLRAEIESEAFAQAQEAALMDEMAANLQKQLDDQEAANRTMNDLADGYLEKTQELAREQERQAIIAEGREDTEERLIELERQWAIEALEASDADAAAKERAIAAANEYFDALIEGGEEVKQISLGEWMGQNWQQVAQTGVQLLGSMASIATTLMQKEADEQNRILDELHEKNMERIETEKQERLFAAGFVKAANEEQYAAEIEAAKLAGDEILVYQQSRAYEKYMIEKQAADEEKRLEEELTKKKAQIQYKMELETWKWKLAQTIASTAQAIAAAAVNMWPIPALPMTAMAVALGAMQIAAVGAAKPAPPAFANGGVFANSIIDQPTRFRFARGGSMNTGIMGEAGPEAIMPLTRGADGALGVKAIGSVAAQLGESFAQQTATPIHLTVIMQLDAREVAQVTADVFGSGQVLIPIRGIN
jgi:hypothetical protein